MYGKTWNILLKTTSVPELLDLTHKKNGDSLLSASDMAAQHHLQKNRGYKFSIKRIQFFMLTDR